jgi:hypothetical protein
MKVYGEIELSGITKIVVNRTVVWEREGEIWVKKAGGAKFIYNEDYRIIKLPHQMMYHVNRLLARNVKDPVLEMIGIEENAYKAWPAGNTLNVCRKDLIRKGD